LKVWNPRIARNVPIKARITKADSATTETIFLKTLSLRRGSVVISLCAGTGLLVATLVSCAISAYSSQPKGKQQVNWK
jgi:hypothetical protein